LNGPDDLGSESAGISSLIRADDVHLADRTGGRVAVFLNPLAQGAEGRGDISVPAGVDRYRHETAWDGRGGNTPGRLDRLGDGNPHLELDIGLGRLGAVVDRKRGTGEPISLPAGHSEYFHEGFLDE
jgi:hypothetical protein